MLQLSDTETALHACDRDLPLTRLAVRSHFDSLTADEKLYVHWLGRAAWHGARIVSEQTTPYANKLVQMFIDLFQKHAIPDAYGEMRDMDAFKTKSALSDDEWKLFLEYSVSVLYNLSNYHSFGDSKFIPNLPEETFDKAICASKRPCAIEAWNDLRDRIYSLSNTKDNFIGFPAQGHISGYYRGEPSIEDIETVTSFLESMNILALNTRLFKISETSFEILIASANSPAPPSEHSYKGFQIKIKYGDFSDHMKQVALSIRRAMFCCANETQKNMVENYAKSFETGDMEFHKESQRLWIKDVGPVVECNIGFVETYKDPAGVRAEWEGFVAVVNKEQTTKFEKLVSSAERFIKLLPWGPDFEKDTFNRPDFTSLEVVTFATNGSPPLGINIPNYDDIRQTLGFKNVSLGNVANTPKSENEVITFVHPDDLAMFEKLRGHAFEIQVGLHELLGHGSGKLLAETEPGIFNFDREKVVDPRDNKIVSSWYKPGQTWGSQFGAVSSSYEECRAELVALALFDVREILDIFGVAECEDMDIIHTAYLTMARAGLLALQVYDPVAKKWGQAHMQARFGILKCLLQAGAASITEITNPFTGTIEDLTVRVNRTKILSAGLPAVKQFLLDIQLFKATGDSARGVPWYVSKTSVPEDWIEYRKVVIRKKQPRKVFVQGNTFIDKGTAVLKEYPLTLEGFIESVIERRI